MISMIDVVSGQNVEGFNLYLCVKFGDAMSNTFRVVDKISVPDDGGDADRSVRENVTL
jgi:hypothetical protein